MHTELRLLLETVVQGSQKSYSDFLIKRRKLQGGCDDFEFVDFISQQSDLTQLPPEVYLDLMNALNKSIGKEKRKLIISKLIILLNKVIANGVIKNVYKLFAIYSLLKIHELDSSVIVDDDLTKNFIGLFNNTALNESDVKGLIKSCYAHFLRLDIIQCDSAATKVFKVAAEQGCLLAQANLACMYQFGIGISKSPTETEKWMRRSAEAGCAMAQYNLGLCFILGDCVKQNDSEGAKWLRCAAEQGFAGAQHLLGKCYVEGRGVSRDKQLGIMWVQRAVSQGYSPAKCYLGKLYKLNGDYEEAFGLFLSAAEEDEPEAQYEIASMYEQGISVEQDYREALKWYRWSAKKNNMNAQFNLACMHLYQRGTTYNEKYIKHWLQAAMNNGHPSAKAHLEQLKPEIPKYTLKI